MVGMIRWLDSCVYWDDPDVIEKNLTKGSYDFWVTKRNISGALTIGFPVTVLTTVAATKVFQTPFTQTVACVLAVVFGFFTGFSGIRTLQACDLALKFQKRSTN